jgi:hypothetical protein
VLCFPVKRNNMLAMLSCSRVMNLTFWAYIHHSSVICHTTGLQPLPKRILHLMLTYVCRRDIASSVKKTLKSVMCICFLVIFLP